MQLPLLKSANIVTNFIQTVFLLALVGGFASDSYLGRFQTMMVFGFVELSGFILICIQAHHPQLRPPQSDKEDSNQSKKLSTYFNIVYFAFCIGKLVALTLLVWVQSHIRMDVGFGIPAAAIGIGMISLISVRKRKQICPSNAEMLHVSQSNAPNTSVGARNLHHTNKFSPTREHNEHRNRQQLQNPTRHLAIHPLHHAHLRRPTLRNTLRPTRQKNHWQRLRDHSSSKGWCRAICRDVLDGIGCHGQEQKKGLGLT
ncbi:putative RING/U-box superfamily protein [Hibiscus syriacus]|uniref:RING/U-box superfamily protein n=1 Tax=Hibiscus syriacus TaxID=106335 RepID=A0A6A2Y9T2_HIBSY|nr:putative RING/U-box superfamily protein [Hibiscus syriacus]